MIYAPEFAPMSVFKAGPGDTAKLVAKIRAAPDADVAWAKKTDDGKAEKIDKKDKKFERQVKN